MSRASLLGPPARNKSEALEQTVYASHAFVSARSAYIPIASRQTRTRTSSRIADNEASPAVEGLRGKALVDSLCEGHGIHMVMKQRPSMNCNHSVPTVPFTITTTFLPPRPRLTQSNIFSSQGLARIGQHFGCGENPEIDRRSQSKLQVWCFCICK